EETRSAAVIGFAAGLLADADFLIQSANDPLLNLDYHRHFTHALVFIPAGALIAAFFLRLFFRRRLSFKRIYIYSLMGYSLSGALDACTGYGTHLFWPFSESRVALNLISIIDPIFSGALLCAGLAAVYTRRAIFARIGLIFCAAYLAFAGVQQHRALEAAESLAARRGHIPQRAVARPSFANTVIWRSVYIAEGRIYIDAVRAGVFNTRIYEGESVAHFKIDDAMLAGIPRASTLGRDIHRFAKFSDGYIGIHPALPNILGDLRYSMLPDSARPLWGIVLNPQRTERHAEFRAFRKLSPEQRRRLLNLLAGREAPRSAPLD
ncbi:MAG: metal-dependent hydrolase, partial [Leptospirales bacterium]